MSLSLLGGIVTPDRASAHSKILIKGSSVVISLFLCSTHHPLLPSIMNAQSFLPFSDEYSPPRSRTTAASIWAPQPQQLDSTWPNAIDTFSRDAEKAAFGPQRGLRGFNPMFGSEDVFGPVGLVGPPRKRDIGAIGDGRKRQSPELDDDARLISRFFRRIYSPFGSNSTSSSSCALSISILPRFALSSLLGH